MQCLRWLTPDAKLRRTLFLLMQRSECGLNALSPRRSFYTVTAGKLNEFFDPLLKRI